MLSVGVSTPTFSALNVSISPVYLYSVATCTVCVCGCKLTALRGELADCSRPLSFVGEGGWSPAPVFLLFLWKPMRAGGSPLPSHSMCRAAVTWQPSSSFHPFVAFISPGSQFTALPPCAVKPCVCWNFILIRSHWVGFFLLVCSICEFNAWSGINRWPPHVSVLYFSVPSSLPPHMYY